MYLFTVLLFLVVKDSFTSAFSTEDATKIDNFITGLMSCSGIPGASFTLVQNDQVLMAKGYGLANIEAGIQMTSKTKMAIGSLSKAFNSALLASVLSKNTNVTWDTPVREVFGDWFYLNEGYMSNKSSLRDLLAHKTVVPRHDFLSIFEIFPRDELLRRLRFFPPVAHFRTQFLYNNNMHIAGGEIARVIEGKPWEDLLQEHLLDPLGMSDTVIYHKAAPSWTGFSIPYTDGLEVGDPVRVPFETMRGSGSVAAPAGGVCSTADDMAKWIRFHLNDGRNENGSQVVDVGNLQRTKQAEMALTGDRDGFQKPYSPVTDITDQVALGWQNGFYRGYRTVLHSGSNMFTSHLTLFPDLDIGIFISFNIPRFQELRLTHAYAADITLGLNPWLDVNLACNISLGESAHDNFDFERDIPDSVLSFRSKIRPQPDGNVKTARALQDYVGTYGNYGYGNLTIALNSGDPDPFLELSIGNLGQFRLVATGQEHEFIGTGVGPASIYTIGPLQFQSSDNQTINELQTTFEPLDPPLFIRDLKMDSAPPPPNNNC